MSKRYVVFGSWKLRHNEPLCTEDKNLALFLLSPEVETNRQSLLIDLETSVCLEEGIMLKHDGERSVISGRPDNKWFLTNVPLVIIEVLGEDYQIIQSSLRIDLDFVQFMSTPEKQVKQKWHALWQEIYQFFDMYHLYFSNHECYFNKLNETTELEQKFHFAKPFSYFRTMQELYTAFNEGEFLGFELKLTDEYQSWSFDNYLYEIQENEKNDKGYVSAIHYCKKKSQWDDPLFMYKKKIYNEDALERWEKNYENQWVEQDIQGMLEKYFGYPTAALPVWRRTRSDIGVESVNGNVFMINIDDCRINNEAIPEGHLQQCEIEYISTRGIPNKETVYKDFHKLVELVEGFFSQHSLKPEKTYYSKLTFLRDYVKGKKRDNLYIK